MVAIINNFTHCGATDELAPGIIGGEGAWRGTDMLERRDDWVYRFTNGELSELDNALKSNRPTINF